MLMLRVYISRDNTGETARGCGTPEILVARSSKLDWSNDADCNV